MRSSAEENPIWIYDIRICRRKQIKVIENFLKSYRKQEYLQ